MATFFVFDRPAPDGRWQVRRHEGGNQRVQEWHADQASAIAAAAELNDRAMRGQPLPPPLGQRLPTAAQIEAVFHGTGATPVHRHWVHHKNQHTD